MSSSETLLIRPISPDDKQQLVEGFRRLGERSRYRRFLSPHEHLSEAELRYLTEVDHHDHEALIAIDPDSDAGVGVARYVRSRSEPSAAELAVAVVDDWQGRGVGGRLAAALADRAREEGITSFTALVLADNQLMLNLLHDLGRVRVLRSELYRRTDGRSTRGRLGAPAPAARSSRARRCQSPWPPADGVRGSGA